MEPPLPTMGCNGTTTPFVRSCDDADECGIYTMLIGGIERQVYCQVATSGRKFIVIQRRDNFGEPVDLFFQEWLEYQLGFGDLTQSFWIGLDALYNLTETPQELHIEMEDFKGVKATVIAHNVQVASEDKGYQLSMSGVTPYELGKSFWLHRGMKFSTKDKDQDGNSSADCANTYKGGWWYRSCHFANLNGQYLEGPHNSDGDGVNYYAFRGFHYSLKRVEMKLLVR